MNDEPSSMFPGESRLNRYNLQVRLPAGGLEVILLRMRRISSACMFGFHMIVAKSIYLMESWSDDGCGGTEYIYGSSC